jgi:colanic acid/amylovoran biosynthesis glycosyltransferase
MSRPVVASYCTTFLKREMLHIYRQIAGLRRHDTFVMTKTRENAGLYPFDDVVVLPRPRINFLLRFQKKYLLRMEPVFYRGEYDQLVGVLGGRRADLLHVYFGHTGVHLLPFIRNWPGPSVVSFHGMDIMWRDGEPGYNDRLHELLRVLPMVMARSDSLARRLVEMGCEPEKIRINRTAIPMDAFPASVREAPSEGSWRIVQASRFIAKKGLADSVAAFAAFHARFPRARLVLAGEGPLLPEIRNTATRLGVGEAVEFPGFLGSGDLALLYASAHLFIHPSVTTPAGDREGVPNSLLEAMATGLPVVATAHGGIPEAVTDGVDGLLVPEHSPDDLAAALESLAADPLRLRSMSIAAATNVRENFEATRSISRLEGFYEELAAESLENKKSACQKCPRL